MNQKHDNKYPKYFSDKPLGSIFLRVYYGPQFKHVYDAATGKLDRFSDGLPMFNDTGKIEEIITEDGNYLFTRITRKEFLQLIRSKQSNNQ